MPKSQPVKKVRVKKEERSMNSIVLLIGRRLVAAVEREMRAIDDEINQTSNLSK